MATMTREYSSLVPFADGSGWHQRGNHYIAECRPLDLHAYSIFTVKCNFVDKVQLIVSDVENMSSTVAMVRSRLVAGKVEFTAIREDLVGKADLTKITEFVLVGGGSKWQCSNFTGSRTRSASILSIGATI